MKPFIFTCPCCGQNYKVTKRGVVLMDDAFFNTHNTEQDVAIAEAIASSRYEFGIEEVKQYE